MTETPKTVFVTKYALTGGIVEREVIDLYDGGMVRARMKGAPNNYALYFRPDYALSREDAIKQADDKRDRKLASLRKQIAKLEAMTFAEAPTLPRERRG